MPDAFFSSTKSRKRKRQSSNPNGAAPRPSKKQSRIENAPGTSKPSSRKPNGVKKRKQRLDEELESDQTHDEGDIDDMDLRPVSDEEGSGDEIANETPAEKRLRLAKLYLESVKEDLADGEFDAADVDRELISARLRQDVLDHSGKVHLFIAEYFDFETPPTAVLRTKGHRLALTCAVTSESARHLFTSGKEGSIIKWDLSSGRRIATFHKVRPPQDGARQGKTRASNEVRGHTDEVLTLALSWDGKYLASAGKDRRLGVWGAEVGEWIRGFVGPMCHKDLISAICFRKDTYQLFTGSFDRTLKLFDLSPSVMGYVETLYGHQDHVLALDALRGEHCVSVGGRDKSVRYWKIVEETQLVFRGGGKSRIREVLEGGLGGEDDGGGGDGDGGDTMAVSGRAKAKGKDSSLNFVEGSLECVAMIDETTFLSGGDSGSISLWTTQKKKPVFTHPVAHGFNEVQSETEGTIRTPRWITSLACLRYSDIFVSGSWEGLVRVWRLDAKLKSFSPIGKIPAPGVINSLQLLSPPKGFAQSSTWAKKPESAMSIKVSATGDRKIIVPESILLVAGVGQEHRLGRWLTVKDGGAFNGSLVAAFFPRTLQ